MGHVERVYSDGARCKGLFRWGTLKGSIQMGHVERVYSDGARCKGLFRWGT